MDGIKVDDSDEESNSKTCTLILIVSYRIEYLIIMQEAVSIDTQGVMYVFVWK